MHRKNVVSSQFCQQNLMYCISIIGQIAFLIAIATVLLWPAPVTSNLLPAVWSNNNSSSDLLRSHWPTALLIQRTFVQEHRLPLWNPYYGGGQPLAADSLAALFYPPTHLVHFLSLRDYYLVLMMGHLVFAGLGTLLLARRALRLSHLSALVAAVAFMATPRLLGHLGAGHVTLVQTVAWFPWLALACWATMQEPRRWSVVLGICFAMTLLAGHPQMAYYGLLMAGTLALWILVQRWRGEGRQAILKPIMGLVVAGFIGILLAAVYLLPLAEFTARSTRQLSVSSGDTYPLQDFLHALIDPNLQLKDSWESILTPGPAVLLLAMLAVVARWRKVWPLLLGVVLVAGLAMGNSSWFYLLIAHILPGFDLFRGLSRIWLVALVPIALLAGVGTELLCQVVRRISSRGAFATGLFIMLVVTLTLSVTDKGYVMIGDANTISTPSLLARTASQLAGSGRIYSVQENISQVDAVQLQTRLADGWNPLLIQSFVTYMDYAGGYTALGYQLHIPYDSPTDQPNAALLGLMNVSIVVSRRPLTDSSLVQVGKADNTLIYRNTANAGPAYLIEPDAIGQPPSLDHIQRLDTVVNVVTPAPEEEVYTFSSATEGYLVIATPSFPGWTASLDHRNMPIQLIAGVLPAIKVSPGAHTLNYSYDPSSVRLGALLSMAGLLGILTWLVAEQVRRWVRISHVNRIAYF